MKSTLNQLQSIYNPKRKRTRSKIPKSESINKPLKRNHSK